MTNPLLAVTLCALYALPGPPTLHIQNGTYVLYPVNRRLCPDIDPIRDSIFELYTRNNSEVPQILLSGNSTSVATSNINFNNPTVIFFHGFLESSKSDNAIQIKRGYLQKGNYNVILVNNERLLAGIDYITSALNCKPIAKFTAKFIDFLVSLGLKLSSLHIIGMSLGGQIAGLTGKFVTSGKVARITGLDPAGPFFNLLPKDERIEPNDAEFVDVVHTNSNLFGTHLNSGDIDIWYNGGASQPGCSISQVLKRNPVIMELIFCNHYQAYRSYVQALYVPQSYLITQCSNYDSYRQGKCGLGNKTYLGEDINQNFRGNFYITTGPSALNI